MGLFEYRFLRVGVVLVLGAFIWALLHYNLKNDDLRLIMDLFIGLTVGYGAAAAWHN